MRTKVVIQITTYTEDPEVEKRLMLAAEDEDSLSILELLEYCENSSWKYSSGKELTSQHRLDN